MLKFFRITGLTKIFRIFDSSSAAVEALSAEALQPNATANPHEYSLSPELYFISARIYTSRGRVGAATQDALSRLLDVFKMKIEFEFPIQYGSWFREFIVVMKNSSGPHEPDEQLSLIQQCMEQQVSDMSPGKVDEMQSRAVANLLLALAQTANAAVQIQNVLLVKVRDMTITQNLAQLGSVIEWEKNELFRNPKKALHELQRATNHRDS